MVELYVPRQKFNKFESLFGTHIQLNNIDFSTGISIEALRKGDPNVLKWYEQLPDMDKYDLVISDNLPEILYRRHDAVLSGHFFWHDILNDNSIEYQQASKELLSQYNPVVIASDLFASNNVRNCVGYIPVGLYYSEKPNTKAVKGDALLITGGSTSVLREDLQLLVERFMREKPSQFEVIFVDIDLLPTKIDTETFVLPDWLKVATYDTKMYQRTRVAICRPGIGTVTDLLQHGGFPICVYESDNLEVKENANRLEDMGLGIAVGEVEEIEYGNRLFRNVRKTGTQQRRFILPNEILERLGISE